MSWKPKQAIFKMCRNWFMKMIYFENDNISFKNGKVFALVIIIYP